MINTKPSLETDWDDTTKTMKVSVVEGGKCWEAKIHYAEGQSTVVNGITIPMGHYWQSGKIRPTMKKPKKAARK